MGIKNITIDKYNMLTWIDDNDEKQTAYNGENGADKLRGILLQNEENKKCADKEGWIKFGYSADIFRELGLCVVGTVVRISSPNRNPFSETFIVEEILVGHVNELGGGCDCCSWLDETNKIEEYKIVWGGMK